MSHHVAGTGEVVVEQTLEGHPAVHGEQVPGQGVVRDLHLHVVIDAGGERGGTVLCRKATHDVRKGTARFKTCHPSHLLESPSLDCLCMRP